MGILKPINKLRVSRRATKYLDEYFKKTGLRPNILARNAMMFSISNGDLYNELLKPSSDGKDFNLYTLFGEHEDLLLSLLQYYYQDWKDEIPVADIINFHIEKGIMNDEFLLKLGV
jgi:DNA sulfur modification protein DndE